MAEKRLDVAMIMDGNRRWAVAKGLPKVEGHRRGAETLRNVLKLAKELNFNSLTLYTFSTENFNRSKEELDYLFDLFRDYFSEVMEKGVKSGNFEGVKIRFLGDLNLFPEDIKDMCKKLEEKTENNNKYTLQFCFGYGGRYEIREAVKKIVAEGVKVEDITDDVISAHLYSSIEPDIVIRTSGEHRLSNFLTWQTVYSEWFFIDTPWPAFGKKELLEVIDEYHTRERRRGK